MTHEILQPVVVLVAWTMVVWIWMYATRIPAMNATGLNPQEAVEKSVLQALPLKVRQVADNFGHLHEQPTTFYALAIAIALLGLGDALNVMLAWAYVALRFAHSLVQCTVNIILLRFTLFVLGTLCLMAMTARALIALYL